MTRVEVRAIADVVAAKHGLDPLVLCAIWWLESSWRPEVVNQTSFAVGLGGVLSHESAAIYGDVFASRPTIAELKDPATNAEWSARILSQNMVATGGDLRAAVKRYSGGWTQAGDAAFVTQYWAPFQRKLAELQALEVPVADYSRYPRPPDDTGAGVHGGANGYHPLGDNEGLYRTILDEMYRCGLRWVKLLDIDGSGYNACRAVVNFGMTPIVRLYRERPYPGRLTDKQKAAARDLYSVGVRYFERGNEPNVDWEWQGDKWPGYDWNAWTDATFDALAADWIADANYLAGIGGLVALDAPSPGGHYEDIMYWQRFLRAVKRAGASIDARVWSGAWIAVHAAALNHPLDYPDDAVNQSAENKGQTIHTLFRPDGSPTGASNCARKWEAVHRLVLTELGRALPVMSTEGGAWPGAADDPRYPALTVDTASERNAAILRGMRTAPPYMLAFMPWLWANRIFANLHEGFERDAWKRIPGWGNCPANEPPVQPIIAMLLQNPCQKREEVAPVPTPTPTPIPGAPVEAIRNAAVNAIADTIPIPYNPTAAFPAKARELGLGAPLTGEVDVAGYRLQGYAMGILFATIGQWANVQKLTW